MPTASISGTATFGSGTGSTYTITPPAGVSGSDQTWVFMVHASNTQVGLDGLGADGNAHASLVQSSHVGAMSIRLFRFNAFHTTARTGFFYTGTPDVPATTAYAWVAFGLARDAGTPNVPVSLNVTAGAATASITGPVTTPNITPTAANALVFDVIAWPHGTTMTPPGGSTELGESRSGNTASDRSIWVGYRAVSGGANTLLPGITVTNDNPYAQSAAVFSTWTVAFVVDAPPTQWQIDLTGGLPGNLLNYSAADRLGDPGFGPMPRIEIRTDDPPPGHSSYQRLNAHTDDVAPLTANNNPRAQMVSPRYMLPGDTWYMHWWTRFPDDFPYVPYGSGRFHMFAQVHGAPYTAAPPVALYTHGGAMHLVQRNIQDDPPVITALNTIWKRPLVLGRWLSFGWRVHLAYDGTGYTDFWFEGKRQRLGDGHTARWYGTTLEGVPSSTWLELHNTNYRSHSTVPGVMTVDHCGMKMDKNPLPELDLAPPIVSAARVV